MIELRSNFKKGKKDLNCRVCGKHEENQQMLLECSALNSEQIFAPHYRDLFSQNKEKVIEIAMILKKKFEKFQILQVHGQRTTSAPPGAASDTIVNDVSHSHTEDMD